MFEHFKELRSLNYRRLHLSLFAFKYTINEKKFGIRRRQCMKTSKFDGALFVETTKIRHGINYRKHK